MSGAREAVVAAALAVGALNGIAALMGAAIWYLGNPTGGAAGRPPLI